MAFDAVKYKELIVHALEHCVSNEELMHIYNRWVENVTGGPRLYSMTDFDDNETWLESLVEPSSIIRRVREEFTGFDLNNDYYLSSDSGYESFDDVSDNVDIDGIANSIVDGELEIFDSEFDLDELKAQCEDKKYRPLKNANELRNLFKDCTDKAVYVRGKDWSSDNDYMWLRLNSYGTRDGVFTFSLGNMCMTAREWFEKYVFSFTGAVNDYQPFGVEDKEAEED